MERWTWSLGDSKQQKETMEVGGKGEGWEFGDGERGAETSSQALGKRTVRTQVTEEPEW